MLRFPDDRLIVDHPANCCPWRTGAPHYAGSLCSTHCPTPKVFADRRHSRRAVLRCFRDGDSRRSGASFCTAPTTYTAESAPHGRYVRGAVL